MKMHRSVQCAATIVWCLVGGTITKANSLTDKQGELDAASLQAEFLKKEIDVTSTGVNEAKSVDHMVSSFVNYHESFLASFTRSIERYRSYAKEMDSEKEQDQKDIDAIGKKIASAYRTILNESTSVKEASDLAIQIAGDVTNTPVCVSPRAINKALEISDFVSSKLLTPAAQYRARVDAFTPPIYLTKLSQDAKDAATLFESTATAASKNAEILMAVDGADELCNEAMVLKTLVGVKAVIADIKSDHVELGQFEVASTLAAIKQKQDAAAYAKQVRRFLIGLDASFNARIAANNISSAQTIAEHGYDAIQATTREVKSNPLFDQKERDALVNLAYSTWDDIQKTAKTNLEDSAVLHRMVLLRTSNLYNEIRIFGLNIPPAKAKQWQDFKNRFENALSLNLSRPFVLPKMADQKAMFAYDALLSPFEIEAKTYEANE